MKVKWMGSPDFIHSSPENKSKQIIGVGDESNDLDLLICLPMSSIMKITKKWIEMKVWTFLQIKKHKTIIYKLNIKPTTVI